MTVEKKLVAYHLARLNDKNPDVRLKSIQELQQLGDPDALDRLRAIYENDPDFAVRRAAQEAGRVIFLRQRRSGDSDRS
ncbi:HEAT repeat domain-containing protein [Anaerolineae bacterium CFX9]|jgi:HEAT repeat protein|nr:HEAT repeat domain-containing protein [Kamptonema cortianum]MDL1900831.1 HEAT repeat domain-containing protein [Anaerolineae bacterium CFX9]